MFPGKAFMDLMQSLENLSQSYKKKLEEQVPLIEEKIESINEQLIEKIDELNRQLQKPEATEKQKPSMQSI
jgi:polyhydroxyalkanoate synthesis regulator phasin